MRATATRALYLRRRHRSTATQTDASVLDARADGDGKSPGAFPRERADQLDADRLNSEAPLSAFVAVHRVRAEGGDAHREVVGAIWRRVPDALPRRRVDPLSGTHVEGSGLVFDSDRSGKDHRPLVERRPLPGLRPSRWARHVGDAHRLVTRVDTSYVLADRLGRRTRSSDGRRPFDQSRHAERTVAARRKDPTTSSEATSASRRRSLPGQNP